VSTSAAAGGAFSNHSAAGFGVGGEQLAGQQAVAAPGSSGFLASTGALVAGTAGLGLALLAGGAMLLVLSRRRGRHMMH
jgi:hypothetical protein